MLKKKQLDSILKKHHRRTMITSTDSTPRPPQLVKAAPYRTMTVLAHAKQPHPMQDSLISPLSNQPQPMHDNLSLCTIALSLLSNQPQSTHDNLNICMIALSILLQISFSPRQSCHIAPRRPQPMHENFISLS